MDDGEFKKFHTELSYAMRLIKHQRDDADKIIAEEGHKMISVETAHFLKSAMKLDLEYEEKDEGKSKNDIVAKIAEKFNVTKDYVLALLKPQET